jgi:hypothetical protein
MAKNLPMTFIYREKCLPWTSSTRCDTCLRPTQQSGVISIDRMDLAFLSPSQLTAIAVGEHKNMPTQLKRRQHSDKTRLQIIRFRNRRDNRMIGALAALFQNLHEAVDLAPGMADGIPKLFA